MPTTPAVPDAIRSMPARVSGITASPVNSLWIS
jgi:hypothetical protein